MRLPSQPTQSHPGYREPRGATAAGHLAPPPRTCMATSTRRKGDAGALEETGAGAQGRGRRRSRNAVGMARRIY
eukprot:829007-Pyramimonas_sp.AAC.1